VRWPGSDGEAAGESSRSDSEIAEAALKAFSWDVQVPEKRLTLEVQNGFVTLKGEVNWHFQRKAAEENVRKLTGVVGVSNQITIGRTSRQRPSGRRSNRHFSAGQSVTPGRHRRRGGPNGHPTR
jgi:osmotically-inducible protein OsmY